MRRAADVHDLRALTLLLSVQPPQALDPALGPALHELMARYRLCVQQRNALMDACHRNDNEEEGATPMKRRRVSSDNEDDDEAAAAALCLPSCSASATAALPPSCAASAALPPCPDSSKLERQGALTPTSTSDTETRDSSSLIDPGTEQDPPSPPDPAPSPTDPASSPRGDNMAEEEDSKAPPLPEEAALSPGLVGEGPEDVLDALCRTLEAAVALVAKLTAKALPSS